MDIRRIEDPREKRRMARDVLEALTDWFEIDETREQYIENSAGQLFLAAVEGDQALGFLTLKRTGSATAELAVMGVKPSLHRQGIGRKLAQRAIMEARGAGYSFLQVKTVQMGVYPDYDDTNRFYQSLGFQEFEVFPTLWDEANPCQIYVMAL